MKYFILLCFIISVYLCIHITFIALTESLRAEQYRLNYEANRNELESVYRTIGKDIDSSFICKKRK